MYKDEIIKEVWRIRDEYVEQHNHDLSKIVADLRRRQKSPYSKLIDLRDRTKRSTQSSIRCAPRG